jgi:SSS family solute:Na+ symporter
MQMRFSQLFTLILGVIALLIAVQMTNVLELMLYSYAFMVSGLLVPILFGLFSKKRNPDAAIASMISGGIVTLTLGLVEADLPFGLDPNFFGLFIALIMYLLVYQLRKSKTQIKIEKYA